MNKHRKEPSRYITALNALKVKKKGTGATKKQQQVGHLDSEKENNFVSPHSEDVASSSTVEKSNVPPKTVGSNKNYQLQF